jgi:hypothetical protein
MTTFTTAVEYTFCTASDVRVHSDLLIKKIPDVAEEIEENLTNERIEEQILLSSGIVLGTLEGVYNGESALEVSAPYVKKPVANLKNQSPKIRLDKVGISSSAVTELWTLGMNVIESGQNVNFTLEGSTSGSQGTGSDAADFTSTNEHIQILTAYWTFNNQKGQEGDEIYFSTYKHKRIIVALTAMLAAGALLNSLISEFSIKGSSIGDKLLDRAYELLYKLSRPNEDDGISLTTIPTLTIDTTGFSYQIDALGIDQTDYDSSVSSEDEDFDAVGFDR